MGLGVEGGFKGIFSLFVNLVMSFMGKDLDCMLVLFIVSSIFR